MLCLKQQLKLVVTLLKALFLQQKLVHCKQLSLQCITLKWLQDQLSTLFKLLTKAMAIQQANNYKAHMLS